ncbi:MAG: B12-binding domain-containing radical SAM protein [Candidatus Thorarchaeota archaeon]
MSPSVLREINAIVKDVRRVEVLFGFCYPSTYRAGMTGLATHIFYSILNSRGDTSCERYFRFDVTSPVRSVESGRHIKENQIIGFSLTYEEDIINLVQMLTLGSIPVLSKDRSEADPIVLVGGPVVSSNPEPYVDFVDAFVIGEGDLVIHEIVDASRDADSRKNALDSLAEIRGVYVPSVDPSSVERLIMANLDTTYHPTAQVLADVPNGNKREPVFGKAFLLEVSRGCGHSCKFCLVGHICRPRRVRSLTKLQEILELGLKETPVQKVALIASSLGDLDGLEELASWIVDKELALSVPSLRADSVSEDLLASLIKGGQRTLTVAPETGTYRLRKLMGKGLSDDDIENAASLAAKAGMKSLKLYFIIGLPEESEEDVAAIATLTKRLASGTGLKVTAAVNPFVPKAHTRWETQPQQPIEVLRKKMKIIEKNLRNVPRASIETLDPRNARIQAALSVGDRSLGKVIRIAAEDGGYSGWRRAEKQTGIAFFSLANKPDRSKDKLPWSHIG